MAAGWCFASSGLSLGLLSRGLSVSQPQRWVTSPFWPRPSPLFLSLSFSPWMIPSMIMASFTIFRLMTPKFISSAPTPLLTPWSQLPPGRWCWAALQVPQSLACPQWDSDSSSSRVCFGLFRLQILGNGANISSLLQVRYPANYPWCLSLISPISSQYPGPVYFTAKSFWVHSLLSILSAIALGQDTGIFPSVSASVTPLPSSLPLVLLSSRPFSLV